MKIIFSTARDLTLKYDAIIELQDKYIKQQKDLLDSSGLEYKLLDTEGIFLVPENNLTKEVSDKLNVNSNTHHKELTKVLKVFNRSTYRIVKWWYCDVLPKFKKKLN